MASVAMIGPQRFVKGDRETFTWPQHQREMFPNLALPTVSHAQAHVSRPTSLTWGFLVPDLKAPKHKQWKKKNRLTVQPEWATKEMGYKSFGVSSLPGKMTVNKDSSPIPSDISRDRNTGPRDSKKLCVAQQSVGQTPGMKDNAISLPTMPFQAPLDPKPILPYQNGGEERTRSSPKNYVYCYTCEKLVKRNHIAKHLLFGKAQCTKCKVMFINCLNFREISTVTSHTACKHNLCYLHDPFNLLKARLMDDIKPTGSLADKRHIHKKISSYIKELDILKLKPPWNSAIHRCRQKLGQTSEKKNGGVNKLERPEQQKTQLESIKPKDTIPVCKTSDIRSTQEQLPSVSNIDESEPEEILLTQSYNLQHLEELIEYQVAQDYCNHDMERKQNTAKTPIQPKPKSSKKRLKTNRLTEPTDRISEPTVPKNVPVEPVAADSHKKSVNLEFVKTPDDGYYYVVKKAIEECPMCYMELCPSRFTVNVVTFLVTTVCIGCNLTIYFVQDPPEGEVPAVTIVTEPVPRPRSQDKKKSSTKKTSEM
ncbi:uncharacterized protein LOC122255892 [Penaeus japonicus]|uniref:uncharacterized protein LOC122255892 n=1 Tax=Penaeus japonicus TaxID=27405 RepID=UPI001C712FB4|nr:uncharacterized protein LOC122255892 [Penaeus japonicus]XP_042876203.1 uncharacterized protein LOC122255892 [Penaeus japonicus]